MIGEIIEDDWDEFYEKVINEKDESVYRGVYFTKEGKPFVLGIIDPLTGFNL